MQFSDDRLNLFPVLAVFFAVIKSVAHQDDGDQDARNDAGDEHVADRRSGRLRVQDERDARRDDDSQAARYRDERYAEFLVIAHLEHQRDRHAADRCDGCRG